MSVTSFIGDNTLLIGVVLVGGFVVWKFILEPIMNEGKPIKPTEDDIKTFGEKMQENLNTDVDI
tara:strand:- start:2300 stop:2491 length:192 start_codon:yes stop_codon:yes gene_type:complete